MECNDEIQTELMKVKNWSQRLSIVTYDEKFCMRNKKLAVYYQSTQLRLLPRGKSSLFGFKINTFCLLRSCRSEFKTIAVYFGSGSALLLCIFVVVLDLFQAFSSDDGVEIIVSSTIFSNCFLKQFLGVLKVLYPFGVYSIGRLSFELGLERSLNIGEFTFMLFWLSMGLQIDFDVGQLAEDFDLEDDGVIILIFGSDLQDLLDESV